MASEHVLGYRVDPVSMAGAVELVIRRASGPPGAYVLLTNVHTTVESCRSEDLREAARRAFLAVPDGMPLVWLLRRRGCPETEKVTGIEFIPRVAKAGLAKDLRHFFFGGAPGVAEAAARHLAEIVPGTNIAGTMSPPFSPTGDWDPNEVNKELEWARPDIMWVGVGAPKQELWMAHVAGAVDVPVMIGVGAAFDFLAGTKRAAPRIVSRLGFEWLFRLLCEPRRLWRRYLLGNSQFLYLLTRETWAGTPSDTSAKPIRQTDHRTQKGHSSI